MGLAVESFRVCVSIKFPGDNTYPTEITLLTSLNQYIFFPVFNISFVSCLLSFPKKDTVKIHICEGICEWVRKCSEHMRA